MVTIPAQVKFSLYWLILMDSSHSDTDLKGEPSEPLVLGRRMDTLQDKMQIINRLSHNKGGWLRTVITVESVIKNQLEQLGQLRYEHGRLSFIMVSGFNAP